MMNTDKLKELLERIETAGGAEATHRAFLEWAQATRAALPSLIARLEAAEKVVEAVRSVAAERISAAESGDCFNDGWAYDFLDAALTTYDQEKARG